MRNQGVVLVMTLAIVFLLVSLVGGFLYATSLFTLNSGWEETDAKLLWLGEAGLQKAAWNLKTPPASGGMGEGWTTSGTTEALGDGSYAMGVERWDFALGANGSAASAFSSQGGKLPSNAIDGNGATFWESADVPTPGNPQFITVAFPYPLTINKVRFVAPNQPTKPKDYSWQVSSDNVTYSTVAGAANNGAADVTDTFVAQPNVNYLRLRVTQPGSSRSRVRISTLEAIGSKVTSTGTISSGGSALTRKVTQTLVADDGSPESQKAYLEPDWSE